VSDFIVFTEKELKEYYRFKDKIILEVNKNLISDIQIEKNYDIINPEDERKLNYKLKISTKNRSHEFYFKTKEDALRFRSKKFINR
jgi:hypothetical protein